MAGVVVIGDDLDIAMVPDAIDVVLDSQIGNHQRSVHAGQVVGGGKLLAYQFAGPDRVEGLTYSADGKSAISGTSRVFTSDLGDGSAIASSEQLIIRSEVCR